MKNISLFGGVILLLCGLTFVYRTALPDASKSTFSQATGKKLLEYTVYPARPEFVMEHPESLEQWPFDGTIMRPFYGSGQVFNVQVFEQHKDLITQQFQKYAPIKSAKLTDNFLAMYSQSSMDWFSDSDWENIRQYVTLIAKGAKTLGCKGVVFDPEPYGANPWDYAHQAHSGTQTFEEYAAKVEQRGREFMQAINEGFPGAKVLFFVTPYEGFYEINHNSNEQARAVALRNATGYFARTYPLYLPFYSGILEAATDENQLINTKEGAYGNSSAEEFYRQYWVLNQGAKILAPPELREKYREITRVASAVYVDGVLGAGTAPQAAISRELSAPDRLKWLEYNVYQALKTSDEYVWLYGEQVTWWHENNTNALNPVRPQIVEAIQAAEDKIVNGEDIGYEIKPAVDAAKQKAEERKNSVAANIKPKTATIKKIARPPVTDGKLDDAVYGQIPWLDEFVNFAETGGKPTASTRAWAAYDDQNLYLAFRNLETDMPRQIVRDGDIWLGEIIDISVLKPGELPASADSAYFHLMLNPKNERFNRIDQGTDGTLEPFKVQWQSAVSSDAQGWSAEIVLPWKDLGFQNVGKGTVVRLNLARHRAAAANEFTSWSQDADKFQEPENFGTFVLE